MKILIINGSPRKKRNNGHSTSYGKRVMLIGEFWKNGKEWGLDK